MTTFVGRLARDADSAAKLHFLFSMLLIMMMILLIPWPFSPIASTREVMIIASQYQFEPNILKVNKGDRVVIRLASSDVVHGFYLDGYGENVRIEPGISQRIEFVADKSGKFRYRCSVSCGSLHPFMIGELKVSPNDDYWRAVAMTLMAFIGTLIYLWRFPPNGPERATSKSFNMV